MVLPLIQCPMSPKQWNCTSPAPPACHTSPPYSSPSRPPVFGWLLHLKSLTGGHLRLWFILYLFLFRLSIRHPKRWDGVPPCALCPVRLRSTTPPTASTNDLVDCCLKSPNGGHLRPELGTSLYFFVRPIWMLQLMEPAMARAHRTPHACFRPIGSGGAKI